MDSEIEKALNKAGVASAQKHVFVCIGPDCCHPKDGEKLWEYLKKRVKELHLPIMRTKAGCFRICTGGPLLVVYPDGIWYGNLTEERCERILQEHILQGKPVKEWIIACNPLHSSPVP